MSKGAMSRKAEPYQVRWARPCAGFVAAVLCGVVIRGAGAHWIDVSSAPRRNPRRQKGDAGENAQDHEDGNEIHGSRAEKKRTKESHDPNRQQQPDGESDRRQSYSLADEQANDLMLARTECDAQSNFACPLSDGECDDRVHADAGKNECQHAEREQQTGPEPRLRHAFASVLSERLNGIDRNVRIDRSNLATECGSEARRIRRTAPISMRRGTNEQSQVHR